MKYKLEGIAPPRSKLERHSTVYFLFPAYTFNQKYATIAILSLVINYQQPYSYVSSKLKQESCAITKMTARCTIQQYVHRLKLESPFVPSSTDYWAVRAKTRQKTAVTVAVEAKPEVEIWRLPKKSKERW